jgi:hypothetical protein
MDPFATTPVVDLQLIKGVEYPLGTRFRQLLITGPPGSGKSRQVARIGGWVEEGAVDLCANRWWTSRDLAIRPREVHLCMPFVGVEHCLTVFASEWNGGAPPELEPERIVFPPRKRHFLSIDWRNRFLFEFLLPTPETVHQWRLLRRGREYHPDDDKLDPNTAPAVIVAQLNLFRQTALHMHRHGMQVILRESGDHPPHQFIVEAG